MLALLGQSSDVDKQLRECQKEVEALKAEIAEKTKEQDTLALKTYAGEKPLSADFKADRTPRFRIRRKMPGHFGKIYALHWGSDGQEIVSASQDGKLLVWNAQTTNKKIAIPLRSAWVMTTAYSPDQGFVASGGLDNLCSIFNVKDSVGWEVQQPQCELQQHEGYLSCCRFLDETHILTASGDASCILWDIPRQTPVTTFAEHSGDVESVSILPEQNMFVSGAIDATAKIWDLRGKGKCVANFKGHTSDINSVQWFPDGNAFVSGSDDASCRLFDLRSHRQLNKYSDDTIYGSITSVDVSKSGYFLFTGYDEEPFCISWGIISGAVEFTLEHDDQRCSCLQVSEDGYALATGCWDKNLRVWA